MKPMRLMAFFAGALPLSLLLLAFVTGAGRPPTRDAADSQAAAVANADGSAVGAPAPVSQTGTVSFAVIGDFGWAGQAEEDVADLVKSWSPDLVITTGDNNYPSGSASTIDQNIGQYYHEFIYPYTGSYGPGATENRFFPSLGNHDWDTSGAQPYLDYFTLPDNERYYDFTWGPVHFFAVDSDGREPDGNWSTSTQGQWLQSALAASTAPWQVVYTHHAPYSSASVHGSTPVMQWPYQSWGADAVLAGHDHTYERLIVGGLPYFVVGLGGRSIYGFGTPVAGSQVRYNADYGSMLVEASDTQMTFSFYSRAGALVDSYTLTSPEPTPTPTATPPAVVGGMAELPNTIQDQIGSPGLPAESSTQSAWVQAALAAGVAVLAFGIAAAAWYATRRWLK